MKLKQIFIFILLLFLTSIIYEVSAEENTDALTYIRQASARFQQKNFQGAISSLDEAISLYPNNPQLYLNRGFIKHFMHDYDSALFDYNKALQISPNYAYAYNNRGVLRVSLNDLSGAFADYDKALNINPKYSDVYYNRANLKYMLDDYNGAIDDYNQAIALNPKDSEAYNNRGVVKKRMNYNVGALSDYSQAIAINPKDSIAFANRGRLKKLYFDNEGAAIDLNQAIELAENQAFIKNVKPLLSNQQYIAAIPSVVTYAYDFTEDKSNRKESQQDESTKKIAMNTMPVINSIQKQEPAKTSVGTQSKNAEQTKTIVAKKSEKRANTTPVINAGVGKIKITEAPDIRTTAVTKNATNNFKLAESYYIRGLQKCVLKDLQGAIDDLDKAIANNSKYAEAYYYRAAIKKELGDKDGFRQDYSAAIQIKPSLQAYNDSDALSIIN